MYTSIEPFTTPIICAEIHCMAWLADEDGGGLLATGNTSSAVSVAIVNEGPNKHSTNNSYKVCVLKPVLSSISRSVRPQLNDVTHVSWSKKFQFLASCHGYNHVLIWDRHGNRVTNKPVVIIRDDSRQDRDVVPACIVTWAHSQPVLLITYKDGVMKLVKVTNEENSSSISVDNISFSDAYTNGEHGLTSACWGFDDKHIFSATSLNHHIYVTNVDRRTVVKKLKVGIGNIKSLKSWYSPEYSQIILVQHTNGCISLVTVDSEFELKDHTVINLPFSIGSAEISWRDTDGMIAVGSRVVCGTQSNSMVHIYHINGKLMKKINTPCNQPIAAVCWVGSSSLSVATKNHVHVVNVSKEVPTLEYLAGQKIPKLQKQQVFLALPLDIRVNLLLNKRTLPKNTPRVFTDTESASQCTLKVIHGRHALQEAQFMVAEVGGEAVALRAIRQTALMSLGNHYEILLRNDCLQTDEPHLSLLQRVKSTDENNLHCTYSDNFCLALRMQHKPLSRGTSTVCSLGNKGTLFYSILYSEKRSLLSVKLYNNYTGTAEYNEASGLVHRPCDRAYSAGDARSIVLLYQHDEVFQLVRWQEGNFSVRYKAPFSMCAAFCTAVSCISRKLI